MTEDETSMDVKNVQQKNVGLAKRYVGQDDLKRRTQRTSKSSDVIAKNAFWASSMKHQNSDRRGRSSSSEANSATSQEETQLTKAMQGKRESNDSKSADGVFSLENSANGRSSSQQNGLLNFKFAPLNRFHYGSSAKEGRRSWSSARSPIYSKEAYLQANCQFVVQEEGNYLLHAVDPDALVDWNLVEQVCILGHDTLSCPICLEVPVAAKITKCGHVYCWSCILHYLCLSEKSWRKCPICYESIVAEDLKSVVTLYTCAYKKGEKITLQLMRRKKGSMLSWPISCLSDDQETFIKWTGDTSSSNSKLQICSPENVHEKIVEPEMTALETQLENARFEKSGEECFIESAIVKLKGKEQELLQKIRMGKILKVQEPKKENDNSPISVGSAMREINDNMCLTSADEPAFSDDESESDEQAQSAREMLDTIERQPVQRVSRASGSSDSDVSDVGKEATATAKNSEFYYFYQAEDGQNMYLQPINVRCLIREYGSLEACPEKLSAQIINIDSYTMTKDLRLRYRYLSHLPVSCGFSLCELMLKPPTVSRETLREFSQEFYNRKLLRQKKRREERKMERKIENRKTTDVFGREIFISAKEAELDLESFEEFPSQNDGGYLDCPQTQESSTYSAASPNSWGSSSFANALQTKNKTPISASGTRSQSNYYERAAHNADISGCNFNEDYVPVPSFTRAFSDALGASLQASNSKIEEPALVESKTKKKKQKGKRLLFSTGGFMKYS